MHRTLDTKQPGPAEGIKVPSPKLSGEGVVTFKMTETCVANLVKLFLVKDPEALQLKCVTFSLELQCLYHFEQESFIAPTRSTVLHS